MHDDDFGPNRREVTVHITCIANDTADTRVVESFIEESIYNHPLIEAGEIRVEVTWGKDFVPKMFTAEVRRPE